MLKLVIGNKNYSSWSMRPWLALRANDIPFEEIFVPLYTDQADKDRILSFSKAGKVPTLIDGDVTVWDSLAIIEYLAEKFPEAKLWPSDRAARAHARAISAEDARANVTRIEEIWADCHARYGKQGPFLFGAFSGADAMYAPVVHRFRTYAIPVKAEAQHYVDAMMQLPAFQQWTRDGLAETLRIERFEDA